MSIPELIPLIAAVKPSVESTFVANGVAIFNKGLPNIPKIDHKAPPDIIIFFICDLFNFVAVPILFSIVFLSLIVCLVVKTIHEVNYLN